MSVAAANKWYHAERRAMMKRQWRSGRVQRWRPRSRRFESFGRNYYYYYYYHYLLTPWSIVLFEKLTVNCAASQEIPHIYRTQKFLTVPTRARHLSLS
jgi:hypothetical protein